MSEWMCTIRVAQTLDSRLDSKFRMFGYKERNSSNFYWTIYANFCNEMPILNEIGFSFGNIGNEIAKYVLPILMYYWQNVKPPISKEYSMHVLPNFN